MLDIPGPESGEDLGDLDVAPVDAGAGPIAVGSPGRPEEFAPKNPVQPDQRALQDTDESTTQEPAGAAPTGATD
jgi:hypothetical protein